MGVIPINRKKPKSTIDRAALLKLLEGSYISLSLERQKVDYALSRLAVEIDAKRDLLLRQIRDIRAGKI